MKLIIFFSFLFLAFPHTQCTAKVKQQPINNEFSVIGDTIKKIYFNDSLFNSFYQQDKLQLSDTFRLRYLKLSNKILLDSAKDCVYGIPFASLQKDFTEEKRIAEFGLGMKLLLLCMEREIADAYAVFGDILKLYDNTAFNVKETEKNKQKFEQYLLKSTKMGSVLGWEILAYWYMEDYKNTKEGIKIYHYLADSLDNESAIFELYRFYRDGYYDMGEFKDVSDPYYRDSLKREHYFEKLIKMKNPYALDIKADNLLNNGKKDEAYIYYVECFLWYYKSEKYLEFRDFYIHKYDELLIEKYQKKWKKYKREYKIIVKNNYE